MELLVSTLEKAGLPTTCNYTAKELAAVALTDKKRKGDTISLVVPHSIGDTRLMKLDVSQLTDFISKGL